MNRRVIRKEGEQAPNHDRDEKKVADQDGAQEAAIAERIWQMRQRNLREGRVEQESKRRPKQNLEGVRHARRNGAERKSFRDSREIEPDLVPFELLSRHAISVAGLTA